MNKKEVMPKCRGVSSISSGGSGGDRRELWARSRILLSDLAPLLVAAIALIAWFVVLTRIGWQMAEWWK